VTYKALVKRYGKLSGAVLYQIGALASMLAALRALGFKMVLLTCY